MNTQKPKVRKKAVSRTQTTDGMNNVVSALGINNAKVASGYYKATDVALNAHTLNTIFKSSTWFGKICTIPADDATREWRSWQASKEEIETLENLEKKLKVRNKVHQAIVWSRLYGGAVIIPGGLPGDYAEPLNLARVTKGSIKWLTVLHRFQIGTEGVIRNPMSQYFGQPEFYTLSNGEGQPIKIHPSRVILVNGRRSGDEYDSFNGIWGTSIWTNLEDSVTASDSGAAIIHALLHETKIDVVRQHGLIDSLASAELESLVIKKYTTAAVLKSVANILLLDGDDEWDQKQINWAGLPQVLDSLLTVMSGASDIPKSRLLGIQQSGLSGEDSGSIRHYYDSVKASQTLNLEPTLTNLDEMLIASALGRIDPSIWYKWNPLWQPSEKEQAEVDKLEAESVEIYARTGLIPETALAVMLQNRLIESASWPGADTAYNAATAELDLPPVTVPGEEEEEDPSALVGDAKPRTLYVRRNVLNAKEIIAHFKGQGFSSTLAPDDLHVTIAYSRAPVDWMKMGDNWSDNDQGGVTIRTGGPRIMERFGEANVLLFASSTLSWRHEEMKREGASWDHPEYQPHVTISYDFPGNLAEVEPWIGEIILGPEIFEEIDEDWSAGITEV